MLNDMKNAAWSDPLEVASDVYSLIMENEQVRVFDVHFKPGQKAVMHGHPNHVIYVLNDYTVRLTRPDGTVKEGSLKAGQAVWMKAGPHASENIGKTDAHAVVIELK